MAIYQCDAPPILFARCFAVGGALDRAKETHQIKGYRTQRPSRTRHVIASVGVITDNNIPPFDLLNGAQKPIIHFLHLGKGNIIGIRAKELFAAATDVKIDILTVTNVLFTPAKTSQNKRTLSKISMPMLPSTDEHVFGGALIGIEGCDATIAIADCAMNSLMEPNPLFITNIVDAKLTIQTVEPLTKPLLVKMFIATWLESTKQTAPLLQSILSHENGGSAPQNTGGSASSLWDMLNGGNNNNYGNSNNRKN
eukprot:447307_1